MRISHKYKFIFFCNPKTGSDSFRQMLEPYSDIIVKNNFLNKSEKFPFYTHISPVETRNVFSELGWDYESYHKIICTRNPFDKLVSLYEMIYKNYPRVLMPSFKKWLTLTKVNKEGGGGNDYRRWRKYGTYSLENLIYDDKKKILVDQIIKLEDIENDVPELFSKLGLPKIKKIVKKNVGKKYKKTQEYYDEELVSLVQQRYSWEINKFNYKLLR